MAQHFWFVGTWTVLSAITAARGLEQAAWFGAGIVAATLVVLFDASARKKIDATQGRE